jgi:peptidoglycan/xylan/chitin deacetylase (PgdA/CDA1 family)
MKPGEYLFSDYYKSNVSTTAVVWITKTDNTDEYINLKNAPASSVWQKYSDSFTLPTDTKLVSVFHIINTVGYLITDDYSVSSYRIQGFSRPLISLTFDDGWEENLSTALPVLDQYGYKATQYYATMYIDSDYAKQQIKAVADKGHEIGSHSVTHPFLTQVSPTVLNSELATSKQLLESIVGAGKITSFATPYGDSNHTVTQAIKNYYQSNRNTNEGWNTKDNFDVYNLRVQNMTNTTTLTEFTSWVQKAQQDKTWLIIVYHRIGANPTQYEATLDNFKAQMTVVSQSGITVKPISSAIAEIIPQMK